GPRWARPAAGYSFYGLSPASCGTDGESPVAGCGCFGMSQAVAACGAWKSRSAADCGPRGACSLVFPDPCGRALLRVLLGRRSASSLELRPPEAMKTGRSL
ncbi:unnamed protein product, partial [Urochloa humidicola]